MRRPRDVPDLVVLARELRQKQTSAEAIFWELVRSRRLLGLKFRRQQQLGPFIADFYCHQARLVVELDGGVHGAPAQADRDANRDVYLKENRLRVLRFTNQQLLDDPESVLREIAQATGCWGDSLSRQAPPSPGRV